MRARAVRVVVEDDVARLERLLAADLGDGRLDAEVHRAHEDQEARRLREQPHLAVVDRDREVDHLVDHGRERGADQRPLHLLGGGVEPVPDHLGRDRVGVDDAGGRSAPGAVDDWVLLRDR